MFKVSHRGNGYRISIGDHRPAEARNVSEVVEAVEHYYGLAHAGTPEQYKDICPFCRQMAQTGSARKGRRE
jgi:hypothetical protein